MSELNIHPLLKDASEKIKGALVHIGEAAREAARSFRAVNAATEALKADHEYYMKNGVVYLRVRRHRK